MVKRSNVSSPRATLVAGLLLLSLIAWARPTSGLAAHRFENVTADGRCTGADYTRLNVADPSGLGRESVCVGGVPYFLTKGLPSHTVGTNSTVFGELPLPGPCPRRFVEDARANEAAGRHRAGDPVYLSCGAYAPNPRLLLGSGVPTGLPGPYAYFTHSSVYRPQVHSNSLESVYVRLVNRTTGAARYFTTTVPAESCVYFHNCYMELRETSIDLGGASTTAYLTGRALCTKAALLLLSSPSFSSWSHNFNAPTFTLNRPPCFGKGGTHYNEYQYAVWELVRINCGTEVDCAAPTASVPPTTIPGATPPPGSPSGTTPPVPLDCQPATPGCLDPCAPGSPNCVDPCPDDVCPPPPNFCDLNPLGLSCTPFDPSGVAFEVVIDHPAQYAAKGSFLAQGARVVSTRLRCDGRTCDPGPDNLDPSKVSLTGRLRLTATSDSFARCTRVGQSGCAYLLVTTDNDNPIRAGESVKAYFFSPTRTSEAVNVYLASPAGRVQTYRWEPIFERVEVECPDGTGTCYESVFTGEYRRVADRVISVPVVVRNTAGQTLPPAGVFLRVFGSVGN